MGVKREALTAGVASSTLGLSMPASLPRAGSAYSGALCSSHAARLVHMCHWSLHHGVVSR